jgi:hypothetical protein
MTQGQARATDAVLTSCLIFIRSTLTSSPPILRAPTAKATSTSVSGKYEACRAMARSWGWARSGTIWQPDGRRVGEGAPLRPIQHHVHFARRLVSYARGLTASFAIGCNAPHERNIISDTHLLHPSRVRVSYYRAQVGQTEQRAVP